MTSHKHNFELPSDFLVLAYEPYGALRRIENWRHIDISCFKRCGKDGDEERTEEKIDEGRDGRELHDDCSEWDIAKVLKKSRCR